MLRGRMPRKLLFGYVFLLVSTVWAAATAGRLYAHVTFGFPGIAAVTTCLIVSLFASAALRATEVRYGPRKTETTVVENAELAQS